MLLSWTKSGFHFRLSPLISLHFIHITLHLYLVWSSKSIRSILSLFCLWYYIYIAIIPGVVIIKVNHIHVKSTLSLYCLVHIHDRHTWSGHQSSSDPPWVCTACGSTYTWQTMIVHIHDRHTWSGHQSQSYPQWIHPESVLPMVVLYMTDYDSTFTWQTYLVWPSKSIRSTLSLYCLC